MVACNVADRQTRGDNMKVQRISIEEGFRLLQIGTEEAREEVNRLIRLSETPQEAPTDFTEWADTVRNTSQGERFA